MSGTQEQAAAQPLFELLSQARFEIGGQDQLATTREKHPQAPQDDDGRRRLGGDWEKLLADLHIRTGTLLKTDMVSFLLGAGASKECGGPLISAIPLELEQALLTAGITGGQRPRVGSWLECFYTAVNRAATRSTETPRTHQEILNRKQTASEGTREPLRVNLESLFSLLHRWRAALPKEGGRLQIDGTQPVDLRSDDIDECSRQATLALAKLCRLPADGAGGFDAYKDLLRKVLTRPLNLKRANIFTLNYDTLVEQAADAEGIVLVDGFVGTTRRVFRPESYDYDLYFPAETTEGRVHRLDRVLHLYKLHGSITWSAEEPSWDNPYGIRAYGEELRDDRPALIYPTPAKWGETLGMPYSELLRRFASTIVRPQSVLFVLGYGFADEHICAIVRQALAIPSFTLVIVDPDPKSGFVNELQHQHDRRVWLFSGNTFGQFTGLVKHVLPDLRDESIRLKVVKTHRSLGNIPPASTDEGGEDV